MTGIVNDLTSTFEIVRRLCGDKWKFLIICYLFNGPKRYGELQYHLDSIKPKVLTENLKELEDLGGRKSSTFRSSRYEWKWTWRIGRSS